MVDKDERIAPLGSAGGAFDPTEKRRASERGRASYRAPYPLIALLALASAALIATSSWALVHSGIPADDGLFATVLGEGSLSQADGAEASVLDRDDAGASASDESGAAAADASSGSAAPSGTDSASQAKASSDAGSSSSAASPDEAGGSSSADAGSSPSEPSSSSSEDAAGKRDRTITVTCSIDSSAADGSVGGSATLTFEKGATAYDALVATNGNVNAVSTSMGLYVSAIGGLAEKEYGATSGWTYYVNGSFPSYSAGNYVLSDGDAVSWVYVTG